MTPASSPDQALLATVATFIHRHQLLAAGPVVIAFSAGPDSLCLLHLLADLAPDHRWHLIAAHLDHGLRPESAAEVAGVRRLAAARGVPLLSERVDGPTLAAASGQGLEATARAARYHFLATVAALYGGAPVATGHTRNDQAETLLLHLERGSGLTGLTGMRPASYLPATVWGGPASDRPLRVVRPLLAVSRQAIVAELTQRGLTPLHDPSNADLTFQRNRVRHRLLSTWAQETPGIDARLARTADLLAADEDYLTAVTSEHWAALGVRHGPGATLSLERAAFLARPLALQRRLLRHALLSLSGSVATAAAIEAALPLIASQTGARADLAGAVQLTVEPTRLRLVDQQQPATGAPAEYPWMVPGTACPLAIDATTPLPGHAWAITCRRLATTDCQSAASPAHVHLRADLATAGLTVRTWRAGDRIALAGGAGHKKLSDLFIDAKVPRAARQSIPLLVSAETVIWVSGLARRGHGRTDQSDQPILCCTIHPYDQ